MRGESIEFTYLGTDDPNLPERFTKGKHYFMVDGEPMMYNKSLKIKTVPGAYEYMFDVRQYFENFQMIKDPNVQLSEA